MADFKADIADASQDLKTIEDFVNLPAGSVVNPRLLPSVDVGTLAGISDAIFEAGGLPATPFATKAAMIASALADGKYAMVTDGGADNGLYVKTAGTWAKSEYDPVSQSYKYSDLVVADALSEVYGSDREIVLTQSAFKNIGVVSKTGVVSTSGFEGWRHTDPIPVKAGYKVNVTTGINRNSFAWLIVYDNAGLVVDTKTVTGTSDELRTFTYTFSSDGSFVTQHSELTTSGCVISIFKNYTLVTEEDLKDRITPLKSIEGYILPDNLFNPLTVDKTAHVDTATGNLVPNTKPSLAGLYASDFIEVLPETNYYTNFNDTSVWVALYDSDKVFVRGFAGRNANTFSTPANVRFVRVNVNTDIIALDDYFLIQGTEPPKGQFSWLNDTIYDAFRDIDTGISYSDARFIGKKLLVTGDSITDSGNSHTTTWWHGFLKNWLALSSVQNDGKSGTGLIKLTGINYRLANWGARYTAPDLILIMGNMNDGTSSDTGAWDWIYGADDAHKDDWLTEINTSNMADSLWYALRYLFEELLRQYPNVPIGFVTSTPRSQIAVKSGVARTGYSEKCWGQDGWFAEWLDVIKLVAGHYSIPVLDLYTQSNMRPWVSANNTELFSNQDGVHPNLKGHEMMAQKILEFTKQYC